MATVLPTAMTSLPTGRTPWDEDTDGDSFNTGDEVADFDPLADNYLNNSRIADLLDIAVDLTSLPQVELVFTESSGTSRTVTTPWEQGDSDSISQDWGGEVSRMVEVGHALNVSVTDTVGANVSVSPTSLGGGVSYERSLTVGFEQSVTQSRGSRVNWNRSQTSRRQSTFRESEEVRNTEGTTPAVSPVPTAARSANMCSATRNNGAGPLRGRRSACCGSLQTPILRIKLETAA